jgi:hypothetical protein
MTNNREMTIEAPKAPEAAFVESIKKLGSTRSRELLGVLKRMNLKKQSGESFLLGDVKAELMRSGGDDSGAEDILHGLTTNDKLYGNDSNMGSLEVSRVIELLEQNTSVK